MDNEFQEKLKLYKEGKLNKEEVSEIESSIDKFIAISDYLNNDENDFFEELKQQLPTSNVQENKFDKILKRKINLRIILITAISSICIFLFFIFLYFTSSKIITSLFGLDYKELYVKREIIVQFAGMFQPQYKSNRSGVSSSLFAQQNIDISLENTIGNTKIDEMNLKVKYNFGEPSKSKETTTPQLIFQEFTPFFDYESDPKAGFNALENAPQGTKAKIFIQFNKPLTAEEIKETFVDKLDSTDAAMSSFDITPIAVFNSNFVLANPSYFLCTTVFPYDNKNAKQLENNRGEQTQYENMDNEAHKESLIGNLYLIKNNLSLLRSMYYQDMFENINIDDLIKETEYKGAEYAGMYISADSKDLLKFKDSSFIHWVGVQNIVIW